MLAARRCPEAQRRVGAGRETAIAVHDHVDLHQSIIVADVLAREEAIGRNRIARQDRERTLACRVDRVLTPELHGRIVRAGTVVAGDVVQDRSVWLGHIHDDGGVIGEVAVEVGILPEHPEPVPPRRGKRLHLARLAGCVCDGCSCEAASLQGLDLLVESARHGLGQDICGLLREHEGFTEVGVGTRAESLHFLLPGGNPFIAIADGDRNRVSFLVDDPDGNGVGGSIRIDRVDAEHKILSAQGLEVDRAVVGAIASAELASGCLVDGEAGVEILHSLEGACATKVLCHIRRTLPTTADCDGRDEENNKQQ